MNKNELDRIEELKRNEDLLYKLIEEFNCRLIKDDIGYFESIDIFKKIGFTEEELINFNIRDFDFENELEMSEKK